MSASRTTPHSPARKRIVAASLSALLAGGLLVATPITANAADPIDGARTAGDPMFPNVGNGGYDALDYDIDLAWTPDATQSGSYIAGTIVATSTMTATAAVPLSSFSLDFEGLTVDSVTVNGAPAAFTREIDAAAITYKLIVTPATPVSGTFTTTVAYHGAPSVHTDADGSSEGWNRTSDGAIMLGQPIGSMAGFPHNNTPADKATYSVSIDIPTTLANVAGVTAPGAAASVGQLLSKVPSGDGLRTTWNWRHTRPMASELLVIAIGRFDVIESSVTLTDGRVIPAWSFVDFAQSTTNKTTFSNRVAQLGTIIRNLETMYGAYPGDSTGMIMDAVPGGVSYALETQDRPFFPSVSSLAGNTLIHELIHQWYGNNVGPTTWTDIWFSEGMATWGPTFYNSTAGFGTVTTPTETTYYNSWNGSGATSPNWNIAPGAQHDSAELYEYQTYTRGAQFWEALKVAIGDTAFFQVIKQWQTRYAQSAATGAQLRDLAEEISGRDLDAFYSDWILEVGKPAWPDKLNLQLAQTPASGTVSRGDTVTYTLTATNTGRSSMATSVATVDLSGVLGKVDLDASSLAPGLAIDGDTLTWTIPVTPTSTPVATTSFEVTVSDAASGGTLAAAARVATLGGTCVACSTSLAVTEYTNDDGPAPTISGDAETLATLTAVTAGWPEGTTFAYAWGIGGTEVDGADEVTFEVPASALGSTIMVAVTATAPGYLPTTLTSAPVGPVTRAAPTAPDEDELTGELKDAIGVPTTANPGDTVEIEVDPELVDEIVDVWMFSTPELLVTGTVDADGLIEATIPADAALGSHRIALTGTAGTVLGWAPIRIAAAAVDEGDPEIAATGVSDPSGWAAAAILLMLLGGGAVATGVVGRRRVRHTA